MENKKSFFIVTLGCKLNIYESESISYLLKSNGFIESDSFSSSDVVIINTCTVTTKADAKSRNFIRRIKKENPNTTLIVCGCLVNTDLNDLLKLKEVDIFIENRNKAGIIDALNSSSVSNIRPLVYSGTTDDTFNFSTYNMSNHSRAFVKIQDGCDNYCAYCKIPYARGENRSRDYQSIMFEVENIINNGFEEIVFTGINIGSYNFKGFNFSKLLSNVASVFNNVRFRVGSVEPQYVDNEFCDVFTLDNVCSSIHIPLQSGSDKILKLMERRYNKDNFYDCIDNLRKAKNNPFISTDLILGFPDEQDEDFKETLEFIEKIDFSYIHLFGFSPRKNTKAYEMKPKIPERVRDQRIKIVNELVYKSNYNYRKSFTGKIHSVVVEKKRDDYYSGKSDNYIDLRVITDKKLEPKKRYDVLFKEIDKDDNNIGYLFTE